jgi:NADH-quinone oxidoreductase subunit J
MVLFIFVIMLLGAEKLDRKSKLEGQLPAAIFLALALLAEGCYVFLKRLGSEPELAESLADSSPQAVGELLFGRYLLPFEAASVLLLAAMVGAIVLTLDRREKDP